MDLGCSLSLLSLEVAVLFFVFGESGEEVKFPRWAVPRGARVDGKLGLVGVTGFLLIEHDDTAEVVASSCRISAERFCDGKTSLSRTDGRNGTSIEPQVLF